MKEQVKMDIVMVAIFSVIAIIFWLVKIFYLENATLKFLSGILAIAFGFLAFSLAFGQLERYLTNKEKTKGDS